MRADIQPGAHFPDEEYVVNGDDRLNYSTRRRV
jgi:hypothetical protein